MDDRVRVRDLREMARQSAVRTCRALALDVGVILGAAVAAEQAGGVIPYLVAIVLIGARQHALQALAHEAAHSGLFASRRANDLTGEIIGWLFLLDFHTYRSVHLAHHRHLNTPEDPDWARYNDPASPLSAEYQFPMPRWRLARLLISDLFGLRVLQLLGTARRYRGAKGGARRAEGQRHGTSTRRALVFYALLVGVILLVGWKAFLLYWVVPVVTWTKMNLRLRLIAEHYAVLGGDGTRSMLVNPVERFLLWPHNAGLHAHHHAYPGVRFFRLPELARRLGDDWGVETGVALTNGLRGLLKELAAPRPTSS